MFHFVSLFISLSIFSTGIKELAFGSGPHVVALTEAGELYCWGHNGYGQLGQGVALNIGQGAHPLKIEGVLRGVTITSVACGGHHTLALSSEGEVRNYERVIMRVLVIRCTRGVCQ